MSTEKKEIPNPIDVSRRISEKHSADSARMRSRIIGELENATRVPVRIEREVGDYVEPTLKEFRMKGWLIIDDEGYWDFMA